MDTDTLNTLVTDAIWRAEELETRGIPSASLAWGEVSSIEEDLAKALSVSAADGRIARRGAVRAALKSRNYKRAYELADRYLGEENAPESLKTALREILEEYTQPIADRFPYASRHHSLREAQRLADNLRAVGAFGLAA
jgi:hypothetical protein